MMDKPCLFMNSVANVTSRLSLLSFSRAPRILSSEVPLFNKARISIAVFEGECSKRRMLPFFTSFLFFSVM